MTHFLYNIAMYALWGAMKLHALFNHKTRLAVDGRKDWRKRLKEKIDALPAGGKRVWFHASSLGEFEQGRPIIEKIKEINEKYWYAILYLSDNTENIWKRYQEKWDDYIKDKKHYHNLKVEYWKKINLLEKVFKVLKINVFEDNDYWQRIIEELFLHDYKYIRNG